MTNMEMMENVAIVVVLLAIAWAALRLYRQRRGGKQF